MKTATLYTNSFIKAYSFYSFANKKHLKKIKNVFFYYKYFLILEGNLLLNLHIRIFAHNNVKLF